MNSFSPQKSMPSWWIEIYTSVPLQNYHLGPFKSREEAKISRGTHVETLYQKEARDIVALIKQR